MRDEKQEMYNASKEWLEHFWKIRNLPELEGTVSIDSLLII
jgi:hypothetical protein